MIRKVGKKILQLTHFKWCILFKSDFFNTMYIEHICVHFIHIKWSQSWCYRKTIWLARNVATLCVCVHHTPVQGVGTVCTGHDTSCNRCCEVRVPEKALINLLTAFLPIPAPAWPATATLLLISWVTILIKMLQQKKKHCNTRLIDTREISPVAKKQCVTLLLTNHNHLADK